MEEAAEVPAVEVTNLRKTFSGGFFRPNVEALCGVSFRVEPGRVFGLLGPNGAGKTTLIKVLLGIVRETAGSASMLGFPSGDIEGRKRVGYLPESLQIPSHQTARTAMEFYGRLSGMDHANIKKRSDELLSVVGLASRSRESVKRFSKGMRQRLGLAQALLHDPDLLILDEPTDGLDPVGRSQVRTILSQLGDQGKTVFVNSHLLQEVELVCDDVAIMNKGQLKYTGSVKELSKVATNSLVVQVTGAKDRLDLVFDEFNIQNTKQVDAHRWTFTLGTNGQSDVNAIVDRLRGSSIDIHALNYRETTLEEFFLNVIGEQAP